MQEISAERIRAYLKNPFDIATYPSVGSTNTLLREAAEKGAVEGAVILASSQTAGRGRLGRSFWSPDGTGVYLSILLRPTLSMMQVNWWLTPAAAVAAARAVEAVSDRRADIKWVNDIYCDKKKVCGILTEGRPDPQTGRFAYAVVGAGFNVLPPAEGFPEDIRDRAGWITEHPAEDIRERLAAAFLDEFWAQYMLLAEMSFYDEYRERCLRLGHRVFVPIGSSTIAAEVVDITPDFALRVQCEDGSMRDIRAGDVSVRFD